MRLIIVSGLSGSGKSVALDALEDMDEFACQLAALDMIVSVDNSTVHLAGALGISTWVLVPRLPNWRWQFSREDTPWSREILRRFVARYAA